MGFFNKKKDSSLRPLSENEIQKRLYGNLKPASKISDSVPHKFKTIPTPEVPTSVYAPAPASSSPSSPAPKSTGYTSSDKNDLFSSSSSSIYSDSVEKSEPVREESSLTNEEKTREDNIMARLGEMAAQEKDLKAASTPVAAAKPAAFKPAPVKQTLGGAAPQKVVKQTKVRKSIPVGAVLKAAGGLILGLFVAVIGLFKHINFRSAKLRTALYWILGAGILIALFFGVHLLNVQREAAMKSPVKKKAPVAEVKKVPVAAPAAARESVGQQTVVEAVRPAETNTAESVTAPVNEPAEAEVAETAADADASSSGEGRYVVQVATYAGPNDANRVREQFEEAGVPVFVKSLSRPSGKIYYSLFVGRFKSYSEAQGQFESFKQLEIARPFKDAFIRTLND